jgi:N-acetylglutamate synthase-like GNAT family acetyltransferase
MSPTITIRIAQSRDAENIAKLCHQLGYPTSSEAVQQRCQTIQANNCHIIYVAIANEEVVGWVHGHLCDLVITPPQIIILGLVVDAQHRGCGIGRLLLQHIENGLKRKVVIRFWSDQTLYGPRPICSIKRLDTKL